MRNTINRKIRDDIKRENNMLSLRLNMPTHNTDFPEDRRTLDELIQEAVKYKADFKKTKIEAIYTPKLMIIKFMLS